MENRNTKLEERIRSVQQSFIASLPSYVVDLGKKWQVLRHVAWDTNTAVELQSFAHKLAGSGGTFGFPDISRTAAVLDVALGEALDCITDDIPPETIVALESQLLDLQRVLNSVIDSTNNHVASELPVLTAKIIEPKGLVVVIDDDELLCERVAIILENEGYNVATFSEPPQAIELLQEEQPVLILLDLMFPGQRWPAFEVISDIRGETGQRTPVAVMSGRADFRSRLQATRAGADAYLIKPLENHQLLATVTQLAARPIHDRWRCLVVDDDEFLAKQLVEWLRQTGMIAEWVAAPRDSWLKVREFRPDVLVLDVNMPECNGIEFATMLRQDVNTSQLPIVFLTSDGAERTRRDAMAAGADDYLLKPIKRDAFISAVKARARLSKRLQDQVSRVTQQSVQGQGLSRHFFFNEFERVLDDAVDGYVQSALVLIGLVEVGEISKAVGMLGLAAVREQLLARLVSLNLATWSLLGENIIGILLPRDTATAHQNTVKNILDTLSASPYLVNGVAMDSSHCAAILHLRNGQVAANAILLQAEQMLGMAIEAGASTILDGFVGASEAVESTGRLPVNRLRMVYQPVVTIADESYHVSTVLARLADAEGNLLPAGQFLSALEQRGWLPELDAWVFRSAHQVLTTKIPVAEQQTLIVHASSRSLSSAVYMETIQSILAEQPMRNPQQCLVIAIPETSTVTHRHIVEQLNKSLCAAGCGLMVSGYGASASSMKMFEYLTPMYVRLDQVLTQRLEQANYLEADRAVIDAAETAKTIIVAGGIESAGSLSGLWAKGIRWFQGYFIQQPEATMRVEA